MNKKKINRSLKKIAKREGVSVEEVRREIELAINLAQKNPDPKIQKFWNSLPGEGVKPTQEEIITHIASIADKPIK